MRAAGAVAAAVLSIGTAHAGEWLGTVGPYATEDGRVIDYAPGVSADTMIECRPIGARGERPAIMLVHGGGWTGGNNAIATPHTLYTGYSGTWCHLMASWGIPAFSVAYRLEPRNGWPDQISDVRAAIRYVRANANALGVNPGMIAGEGDSAGGELVLVPGMTSNANPGDLGRYWPGVSSGLQFVVSQFGPWSWGPSSPAFPVASVVAEHATEVAATLFIQGTKDRTVLPSQSETAYCWDRRHGHPAHYLTYEGGHEYTGMSGSGWAKVVGTLQMRAISAVFEQAHWLGVLPKTERGPGLSYDDPVGPRC